LGILVNFISGIIGMYAVAAGVVGYLNGPIPTYLRILLVPLGAVNVVVNPMVNPLILILTLGLLFFAWLKKRR